jgi:hypothetical protein
MVSALPGRSTAAGRPASSSRRAYGAPLDLDDIEGKNILFVDFSAPADVLRAMVDEGNAKSGCSSSTTTRVRAEGAGVRSHRNLPDWRAAIRGLIDGRS